MSSEIKSYPSKVISNRFLTKVSTVKKDGEHSSSLVIAYDVISEGMLMKFFSKELDAIQLISTLSNTTFK